MRFTQNSEPWKSPSRSPLSDCLTDLLKLVVDPTHIYCIYMQYIYIYIYIYWAMCKHLFTIICICLYSYVYMYTCTYVCMCTSNWITYENVYLRVLLCLFVCVWHIYIYIYIHTHTRKITQKIDPWKYHSIFRKTNRPRVMAPSRVSGDWSTCMNILKTK